MLTNHYEKSWKYYCLPNGQGSDGVASEEELLLTKKLFWGIFDSLSTKVTKPKIIDLMKSRLCGCVIGGLAKMYFEKKSTVLQ